MSGAFHRDIWGRRARGAAAAGALAWTVAVAPSALAADMADLDVETYTGSGTGLLADSHIIMGRNEAILVDAQLTRADALALVDRIKDTGLKLTTIFITHADPDHYLGLQYVTQAFPDARVLSGTGTALEIARRGNDAIAYWRERLQDDVADRLVVPRQVTFPRLEIEGESIKVLPMPGSESPSPSVLWMPDRGWLFTGDLVVSEVHLRLADGRIAGWLDALRQLRHLGKITRVYPGHGEGTDVNLIVKNESYIKKFRSLSESDATAQDVYDALLALYPTYRLPFIARMSADSLAPGTGPIRAEATAKRKEEQP